MTTNQFWIDKPQNHRVGLKRLESPKAKVLDSIIKDYKNLCFFSNLLMLESGESETHVTGTFIKNFLPIFNIRMAKVYLCRNFNNVFVNFLFLIT